MHFRQQDPFRATTSSFFGGPAESPYPGIGNPYAGGGGTPNWPAVYNPEFPVVPGGGFPGAGTGGTGGSGGGSGGGLGGLGNFNLNQVKGFVDKMGGIDGIVSTMTRVQKMVASFQQMAPMLKLLMGSFGGKAAAKSLDAGGGSYSKGKRVRKKKAGTRRKRTGTARSYKKRR